MPEFCTCGAQLPPDARFCHKCGKPQREEPRLVEEESVAEPLPPPPIPVAPEPPAISLRNRAAVLPALLAGTLGFIIAALLQQFGILGFLAGGFLAVYLYQWRTGQKLTPMNGARLGWITGIFLFIPVLISLTAQLLLEPNWAEEIRKQVSTSSLTQEQVDQAIAALNSPPGKILMVVIAFILTTLLPTVGGVVGAKLLRR